MAGARPRGVRKMPGGEGRERGGSGRVMRDGGSGEVREFEREGGEGGGKLGG